VPLELVLPLLLPLQAEMLIASTAAIAATTIRGRNLFRIINSAPGLYWW
jgi:hypothetical protein